MLGHLQSHLEYSNAVVESIDSLLKEQVICAERASILRLKLANQAQVADSVERLSSGQSENAFLCLATNCSMLYTEADESGDVHARDLLSLAARATLLAEEDEFNLEEGLLPVVVRRGEAIGRKAGSGAGKSERTAA